MIFEKATVDDVNELVALRIAYLEEDGEAMDDDVLSSLKANLPDYFIRHVNHDLIAYLARDEKEIIACALLLVVEKPMSPSFITGKTGTVLNVYTHPDHRHQGYAKHLMKMLLRDAIDQNLSVVELKATDAGYNLYKSLGFEDAVTKYHFMTWHNRTM